jgi:hypothetical protein
VSFSLFPPQIFGCDAWLRFAFHPADICGPTRAQSLAKMMSPLPCSQITSSTVTFQWYPSNPPATAYWLDVGTVEGQGNIFAANLDTYTSWTVGGIPTNGQVIYVRLWSLLNGVWQFYDFRYNPNGGYCQATITSPVPGSTLQDNRFRAVGLAGQLARSLPGSVATLAQLWPTISPGVGRARVLTALRDMWRDPNATSVRQLAAMADTPLGTGDLREAVVRALSSVHTREALPFLSQLLTSSDSNERMRGLFGFSSFANGCPYQTNANVASMDYLRCPPGPYTTADTLASFIVVPGNALQESQAASFWQRWWDAHQELH